MPNNLLVTLANEEYLDGAKQVFGSAYFKGGWDGDMMLLAYNVPEEKLKWFRERGILVRMCDGQFYSHIFLAKLEIFDIEFQKWKTVLYLDADVIVRYSLNDLLKVTNFSAVINYLSDKVEDQFDIGDNSLFEELFKSYNLKCPVFNAGVMVFPTSILYKNMLINILALFDRYKTMSKYIDQPILNIFFLKKWSKISKIYNVYIMDFFPVNMINPALIDGVILHFIMDNKPWDINSYFYKEWKSNLIMADYVNLKPGSFIKVPRFLAVKIFFLKALKKIDFFIGKCGIFVNRVSPSMRNFIKKKVEFERY